MFLLGELPRDQARDHLVRLAADADAEMTRLRELEASISWSDADEDLYGHAALEYGLRFNAMQAEWAHWLIKTLDNR